MPTCGTTKPRNLPRNAKREAPVYTQQHFDHAAAIVRNMKRRKSEANTESDRDFYREYAAAYEAFALEMFKDSPTFDGQRFERAIGSTY